VIHIGMLVRVEERCQWRFIGSVSSPEMS
jgi:hypothetical protein